MATAMTMARMLSNIPLSRGGPTSLVIFDIHALQVGGCAPCCMHVSSPTRGGACPSLLMMVTADRVCVRWATDHWVGYACGGSLITG